MPPPSELAVIAPFAGVVVGIEHGPGGSVQAGAAVVVLEAMKMEHEILAEVGGVVSRVEVAVGDAVQEGDLLLVLAPGDTTTQDTPDGVSPGARDPNAVRADLAAVRERGTRGPQPVTIRKSPPGREREPFDDPAIQAVPHEVLSTVGTDGNHENVSAVNGIEHLRTTCERAHATRQRVVRHHATGQRTHPTRHLVVDHPTL